MAGVSGGSGGWGVAPERGVREDGEDAMDVVVGESAHEAELEPVAGAEPVAA